jgi:hypothetical protein
MHVSSRTSSCACQERTESVDRELVIRLLRYVYIHKYTERAEATLLGTLAPMEKVLLAFVHAKVCRFYAVIIGLRVSSHALCQSGSSF